MLVGKLLSQMFCADDRERIWFSPACKRPVAAEIDLFSNLPGRDAIIT
jgi:hypothetical protein